MCHHCLAQVDLYEFKAGMVYTVSESQARQPRLHSETLYQKREREREGKKENIAERDLWKGGVLSVVLERQVGQEQHEKLEPY